jgi:SAM-dependent methyltransferase
MPQKPQHGFTAVDGQEDPSAWVAVLDRVRAEPFYAAYKGRVLELLQLRPGGRYLDVGAGTGDDARAAASKGDCEVVAADRSITMATVCHTRAHVPAVVCEAEALPFQDGMFDGVRADRTLQHLLDPRRAISEMVRVSRTGSRIVAVDPDYDTQVIEFPDQSLARSVLRYRADHQLRNGTIAHHVAGIFLDAGLNSIQVEPLTLYVRDSTAIDNVMGLRTWARTASANGYMITEDANRWERLFDHTVQAGRFLYVVTFFVTLGIRP